MSNPAFDLVNDIVSGVEQRMQQRAPQVEYALVTCGICAGRGMLADGFRGSEREIACPYCCGKGSIVTERQR